MATVWWVVVPPSEQNSPTLPTNAKIVSTAVGSPAYNTWLNTDTGAVNGLVRYMGPFNSQQEAQSAAPGKISIGDWTAIAIGAAITGAGNSPTNVAGNIQTGKTVVNAVDTLGNFNLSSWFLRIGEILLGLVLVGVGIARITGAQNIISQAVRTKIPI